MNAMTSTPNKIDAIGTCQVCLKSFVSKPNLVLHGYARPGWGSIIGECWGVHNLPYELSCELTKKWRHQLISVRIPFVEKRLSDLRSGRVTSLQYVYTDYNGKLSYGGGPGGRGYPTRTVMIDQGAPLPESIRNDTRADLFDSLLRENIYQEEKNLGGLRGEVAWLTQRISQWVYAPEKLRAKNAPHVRSDLSQEGAKAAEAKSARDVAKKEKAEKVARSAVVQLDKCRKTVERYVNAFQQAFGDARLVAAMKELPPFRGHNRPGDLYDHAVSMLLGNIGLYTGTESFDDALVRTRKTPTALRENVVSDWYYFSLYARETGFHPNEPKR